MPRVVILKNVQSCEITFHWVIGGTADTANGDKVTFLSENQSAFIPHGQIRRLANPGKKPLEIIEI